MKLGSMRTYGQYCPIARTAELFAERWTPIIVRNLLAGCTTFGQLLDGAPGISRALLAQRLDALERNGIVRRRRSGDRRVRWSYQLTECGRELKQITDAMGAWGARWLELEPRHTDAAYVLWATAKLVDLDQLEPAGLTIRVQLADIRRPHWLMLRRPYPEVCTTAQGREDDLVLRADSATLARIHLRHLTMSSAMRDGVVTIEGAPRARKAFLSALQPSPFAHIRPQRSCAQPE
jgi:DNA-binding HxlR family transcriptional regulator